MSRAVEQLVLRTLAECLRFRCIAPIPQLAKNLAKRRRVFARYSSFVLLVFLIPSYSEALWSPNFDQTMSDPQKIKGLITLNSPIRLHPGVNNVTFYGVGTNTDGTAAGPSDDDNVPLYPGGNNRDTDTPQEENGKIVVLGDYSAEGCPVNVFVPSASDLGPAGLSGTTNDWSLMPLGSYENPRPIWSAYSDDPNCGNGPIKTIEFYQGTLEGVSTTFMLTAIRHAAVTQATKRSVYDIEVFVFFTEPEGETGAGEPAFGIFGKYTTSMLYANSSAALYSELRTPLQQQP